MKKTELVFVPMPGLGHVVSVVEFANKLLSRDDRFSVTILVTKSPFSFEPSVGSGASLHSLDILIGVEHLDHCRAKQVDDNPRN